MSIYQQLTAAIGTIITLDVHEAGLFPELFTERTYRKGDFFLKEGQINREVGFIGKGLVRYFINKDGEDLVTGFGQENNFVCNYESFLDHSPSTRNIQVIEDSDFLIISYDQLQQLYARLREGQKFGRLICEYLFVEALRQITSLYTDPPEARYKQFIRSYPDLQQRLPQYYISSFVGVKPQSLSRIRKRLSSS